MLVRHQAATEQSAMPTPGFDPACVGEDIAAAQLRREDSVDEGFLGLAFDDEMEPDQREGLPPTTLFSHNSDKV